MLIFRFTIMETTYKSILISLLVFATSNVVSAEFNHQTNEEFVEPSIQLTLLPGFESPVKKTQVLHMVAPSTLNNNLLKLNSNYVKQSNTFKDIKSFDAIEIVNNNLFELRF